MAEISFFREEKEIIVQKIQAYFSAELDREIGRFDAEFLLDFFAGEIGPYFYNRGLLDARAVLARKMDSISEEIDALEKITDLRK